MISFVLTIGFLFGLVFVSFPCEGQINLPPGGSRLTVATGDDATIVWTFKNTLAQVVSRSWTFNSSSQGSTPENIAAIYPPSNVVTKFNSSLPRVEIKKEATLVLRNVSSRYDGTYTFAIAGGGLTDASNVRLFVAKAPTVTFDPDCPIEVDEGENVTTVCKGENGNPPATVTWYKNGVEIGDAAVKENEENRLYLRNVDRTDNGTYKCVAQSYKTFKDEKSCEVIVNFAPEVTSLTSSPTKAVLGKPITIACEASGRPEPTYTINHHNTQTVSTEKTYLIDVVNYTHAGLYQCAARNRLGNSSKTFNLTVVGLPPPTTTSMPAQTTNSSNKTRVTTITACICNEVESGNDVVWHVVVSLLSGVIIGVLLSQVFGYSRRRFRNRKPAQSNPEPQTSSKVDSIYQDLDLSKMNQEENYQTLQVVNSGDGESNYTELNLARNVEDNYQSLQTSP